MAITVKHNKVSTVPDTADTSLVRPSDWNADHTLTGVGTMAEQNANNVNISGGSISGTTVSGYIPTSEKAAPLGVATLDAGGKVPTSQIPLQGDLNYQGTWNASTNTPTLTSSTGTQGYYYVVDVAGTTNLNGITDWQVGDWAIFNGSVWQKVDNTDAVTSVNGQVGTVVLTTTNIAEGTNEYFTQARARQSLSAGTGISYDNTTGVITNSSPSLGGDVVGPSNATDNAIARFDTTTGKLIQNSVVTVSDTGAIAGATTITNLDYLDFDTAYATTLTEGQLGWDGNNTLGLGMAGGNVVQHIGEDQFFYAKATSTITKGQVIMFTGAVGASGVPTGAPATGITDGSYIMGIAAENIATNGFGLIQCFGTLRNINTSGYADGDILWYDPSVTGGLTNVKPSAPNVKVQMAAVINGGSSGGGTILIRINSGSTLGGTDSNAQITSPSNGQILTYDGTNSYWKNTDLNAGTGISVGETSAGVLTVTNTAPDQTVSISAGTGISTSGTYPNFTVTNTAPDQTVVMNSGTGISVSGTYPNFTVTNTAPSSGGTVTSVSGTAPISSSGGNTPAISISQATTSTNGYLSSTDWNTFNNKQPAGSYLTAVTADSPLSGSGTSGSHLVIAQATTSTSGYLSSTDWNTFNNKQPAGTYVTSVGATSPVTSTGGTTPTIAIPQASGSASGYLSSTDWTTFNSKASPFTYTSTYIPYGQGTTTPNQSSSFTFDANNTLNAPQVNASNGIMVNSATISANYSIPSGSNALSAGPVSIANGVTVTVPTGNAWVIV